MTVREAAEAWLSGVHDGSIRTRSGDPYKPSSIRGYEAALCDRVLPELGPVRLSHLSRPHVQDFVDRLVAEGLDASTVRNCVMPLRVICRRAIHRGQLAVNPTTGLELPAVKGRRDRIASPEEANALLDALPQEDRALWATAFYAGLRRGELMALRWDNVDFTAGLIRIEKSWDERAGEIEPKSRTGRRSVPLPAVLRALLQEHQLVRRSEFVFGSSRGNPFTPSNVIRRARRAWSAGGLEPIGLHEARHTYASFAIAAGLNAKAISAYMGHSSVTITYDRYGHLMPGNETEAAGLLDAFFYRADSASRLAQIL